MNEKLLRMKRQEEFQTSQTRESFTATVSHEMRTPLFSVIFFLNQIMSMLSQSPFPVNKLPQATFYCQMMKSQLNLIQTFVEDLLDFSLMREGTFTL